MRWMVRVMTALFLAGTAAAQSPGTLIVGGFGQWTHFDTKWNLDTSLGNTLGWGARVGAFIAPDWSIEGDGSYTAANSKPGTRFLSSVSNSPGGEVKASMFTARVVHGIPSAILPSVHLGGGGVLESFRGATGGGAKIYQFGVNGLAGFNLAFNNAAALRVDGLVNYFPSNGGSVEVGIQAGLQFSTDIGYLFGSPASRAPVTWAPFVWWDNLDAPLPGTLELGGYLQATHFDDHAGRGGAIPKNGIGYGARVGVFLSNPSWEIEGDGYYSPEPNRVKSRGGFTALNKPTEVNAHALAARLLYNYPLGVWMGRQTQFVVGAGGVRTSYKFQGGIGPGSINETYNYNFGVSGLAGLRIAAGNRIAFRIDGVGDFMHNYRSSGNLNLHLRAGMSSLLGGGRPDVMCTYAGLETIPAASPNCVAPPPPPPPPPPPATCQYNANILATDPACVPPVAVEIVKPQDTIIPIKVFYATNRQRNTGADVEYGGSRGLVKYGVLTVTIPPNHKTGKMESPVAMLVFSKGDPRNHVFLAEVMELPKDSMLSLLKQAVQKADSQEVFVFIHGFNTSFVDAARRTAQLAFDLQLLAVPVMYSWPSAAKPYAYAADEETVVSSVPKLQAFLEDVVRTTGARRIHVLAHSMGGRLLSRAIKEMKPSDLTVFENVVLAAPDISAEEFSTQIVPAMRKAAKRVTIYASDNDEALRVSKDLHKAKRLGQSTPTVTVISGFDTIDASAVPGDWMGHSYYAANSQAIDDLFMAINRRLDPPSRLLLKVQRDSVVWWKFR